VWRAKGIVRLAEAPGRRFVLQVVGRRWTLEPAEIDDHSLQANRSEIIVIGLAGQLDPAGLEALFAPAMPAGIPAAVAAVLKSEDRA
jgi:G3E family GTPase